MAEQEGIWGLTLKPRWWLRWLPIEKIDDWLLERANFESEKPGRLPKSPRWYHYWNSFAFELAWDWEEIVPDYTPAPWKVNESPDGKETGITGPESEIVEPVCIVPHDDITEEGAEEVRANIALITHSPAMFEQLEQVRDELELIADRHGIDGANEGTQRQLNEINALIQKIEKAADNG